jgi:hypothetical protein
MEFWTLASAIGHRRSLVSPDAALSQSFLTYKPLAVGQAGDKSEEEEYAASVIREKERFSNELTVVFCTGEIAILK